MSFSTDVVKKIILIIVDDDVTSRIAIKNQLTDIIDDTGIEFYDISDEKLKKKKKKRIRSHLIQGIIGAIFGIAIITLSLSGIGLPMLATYLLLGGSSALTLFLGKNSYQDTAKNLIKNKTLTMDVLFSVSTLAVIAVSIASFFIPSLPMMLETGLLIFGFRHLGIALEESIKNNINSKISFKDRTPLKILKKINSSSEKQSDEELSDDSSWSEFSTHDLQVNDIIRVPCNKIIPIDGICLNINTSIYKTIITGRTIPTSIKKGEKILAGMKVPEDVTFIEILVTKKINDSYLARLDQRIAKANTEKASIETSANKILQWFIPSVLALAAISGIVIGIMFNPALAIQCAASVLVSACPCTLGLITPLAVKIGISKALQYGVQFKSSKVLEEAASIDTVVFDLNGTLTTGIPVVTGYHINNLQNISSSDEFFSYLTAIEAKASHPFAKAICDHAKKKFPNYNIYEAENVDKTNHSGIKAIVNEDECLVGNKQFLDDQRIIIPADQIPAMQNAEQIIYFVKNKQLIGHIKLKDPLREDAKFVIDELKRSSKEVHICTGADSATAEWYAKELGIDKEYVHANYLGSSEYDDEETKKDKTKASDKEKTENHRTKAALIKRLKEQSKHVAMIGDAGNDAEAFACSYGIAIKSNSTDEATQDQAKAIINNDSLLPILTTFAIAKETVRSIKQNLIASLAYNLTTVLIAGGILVAVGFALNPAIGIALMVLQTTLILLNQYRIKQQKLSHLENYKPAIPDSAPSNSYRKMRSHSLPNLPQITQEKSVSTIPRFRSVSLRLQPNISSSLGGDETVTQKTLGDIAKLTY